MTEQIQTDWEKEFEKFEYIGIALDWYMMNAYPENRKPGREHLEDVKQFIKGVVDQAQQQERQRVIEELDRLIETHIRHSFSMCKRLSGNTLDELDLIRQQLNQMKGEE